MKFWDSSALVPLLLQESATGASQKIYADDSTVLVAWTTLVECASAIARAEREGLREALATAAFSRLDALCRTWREVDPDNDLRDVARRLMRVHPLRSADAIQLAAATLAAQSRPSSLTVVTLDERLERAARREGFPVLVPGGPEDLI